MGIASICMKLQFFNTNKLHRSGEQHCICVCLHFLPTFSFLTRYIYVVKNNCKRKPINEIYEKLCPMAVNNIVNEVLEYIFVIYS